MWLSTTTVKVYFKNVDVISLWTNCRLSQLIVREMLALRQLSLFSFTVQMYVLTVLIITMCILNQESSANWKLSISNPTLTK